ncbi:polysaccharide deacetylase [Agrobacterium vitis]|nr:polysaccharide deacetylase [Allorhizobium ampelinum]MUO90803.1 polysaccharide deacetylase [Agrobacterium vitis]MUZ54164.1 polysaccharide deacetylase [Agrobacterium vitis]MUZ92838.1 polysaccharide deacetylase [Agrobacterium vitis]MVA40598.1 polysaccharide deacetylase [Agrobacterium vitis]
MSHTVDQSFAAFARQEAANIHNKVVRLAPFRPLFSSSLRTLLAALCMPGIAIAQNAADAPQKPKQLLLISFDGAADNRLWERSGEIASRANAHFTYFLSCTTLIARGPASKAYQAPGQKPGKSNVGFAPDEADAAARLEHIWAAHLAGHDISSHACGHFDGKDWSKADWLTEFSTFKTVLAGAWKQNGVADKEPEGWQDFVKTGIKGFRAPYLSTSKGMAEAEKQAGFLYDASLVTKGPQEPEQDGNLTRFGLPLIAEGPGNRPIIGMDYNMFVRHSAGFDNPSKSAEFEERTYQAFKTAFEAQYSGDRKPVQFGFHFVLMNGGAYWRAMERLVTDVCHREDVACVSYSQAVAILEKQNGRKNPAGSSF